MSKLKTAPIGPEALKTLVYRCTVPVFRQEDISSRVNGTVQQLNNSLLWGQ